MDHARVPILHERGGTLTTGLKCFVVIWFRVFILYTRTMSVFSHQTIGKRLYSLVIKQPDSIVWLLRVI